MPDFNDDWETRCFGGPLHGQTTGTRDRDHSFQAPIRATHPLRRMTRELEALNRALSVTSCHYESVESQFAHGGSTRRIRCGLAEGISRNELVEYRDYLHAELQRFEQEMRETVYRFRS